MIYYEDFISLIRLIDTLAPTFDIQMANIECLICTAYELTNSQRYDLRMLALEKRIGRGALNSTEAHTPAIRVASPELQVALAAQDGHPA